jgi:DNA-binding GntR family transcriptional regulator
MSDPRKWVFVYNGLLSQINSGELPPGSVLSSAQIASDNNMTRQTAAQALQRLESEGRIRLYPGRGYQVEEHTAEGETQMRTFLARAHGNNVQELEMDALAHAQEVFGPDIKISVQRSYRIDEDNSIHTTTKYIANINVQEDDGTLRP